MSSLFPGDAADRQGKLDVGQDALVRDQVVGLEDEADRVIAVGIPVSVLVILGRDVVDDQVAVIVAVEAADDVQKGRLARTGRSEYCDEFVIAKIERHVVERLLDEVSGLVSLGNVPYF